MRLACFALVFACMSAHAGPTLSLSADARALLPHDEMQVTLATEREAAAPGEANDAVLRALEAALAEARATPGVKARLGGVSTSPRFTREGRAEGWRVRGEIVLESADLRALPRLASRLSERLQLAGVSFRLSEPARRTAEQRLLAEAAQAFRARAQDAARAFGLAGYELRELALDDAPLPMPKMLALQRAPSRAMAAEAMPVPAEGGDAEVVVTVRGTVELK